MAIEISTPFDASRIFSGGAGLFIQYHDIVKPVYMWAAIKMFLDRAYATLPVYIFRHMTQLGWVEWYLKRPYINPIKSFDYQHKMSDERANNMLAEFLEQDESIYTSAPALNIAGMLSIYKSQHMYFPIYIYSDKHEAHIQTDIKKTFPDLNITYLHGDIIQAAKQCDNNFTFMLSDIEQLSVLASALRGTCSHLVLSRDYRYNHSGRKPKYDLNKLCVDNPHIRISLNRSVDPIYLAKEVREMLTLQSRRGI